jgi:hypothetical protein
MARSRFLGALGLLLACVTLGLAAPVAPAHAQSLVPVQVAQKDPYPGATVALDFVGQRCPVRCFKIDGVKTSNFTALPGVTVTRASGGYAENPDGSLVWFQPGQARITNKGLLVEEGRTNLLLWSQDLTKAVWAKQQNSGSMDVATATGAAPDGTFTAQTVTISAANHALDETGVTVAPNTTYTFSFYVRRGSMPDMKWSVFDLTNSTDIVAPTSYFSKTSAVGWSRQSLTFATGSTTTKVNVYLLRDSLAQGTADFWGAQLELGAFATSYIPTTTASATRAADAILLTGLNIPASTYTALAQVLWPNPAAANGAAAIFAEGFTGASPAQGMTLGTDTTGVRYRLLQRSGATRADSQSSGPTLAQGEIVTGAVSTDGATAPLSVSGLTQTSLSTPSEADWGGGLSIGSRSGVSNYADTYIRVLTIYPASAAQAALNAKAAGDDLSSLNLNFASGSYSALINGLRVQKTSISSLASAMGATWSFSRVSQKIAKDSTGALHVFASNVPAITDLGLNVEEARTNKNINFNANPVDLTNVTLSGDAAATLSVVDDAAALAAAGLSTICTSGKVYKLDNTAGTTRAFAQIKGTTGNLNPHSLSIFWRGVGLAEYYLGASTGFSAQALTGSYVRYINPNLTPGTTGDLSTVGADAGSVVFFILNDTEEGSFATSPIVVQGASATRAADVPALSGLSLPSAYTLASAGSVSNADSSQGVRYADLSDGTSSNRVILFRNGSSQFGSYAVNVAGVQQATGISGGAIAIGTKTALAVRVAANNFGLSVGGAAVNSSSSGTVPTVTQLNLGSELGTAAFLDGFLSNVLIYPYAANDNELQYRSAGNW